MKTRIPNIFVLILMLVCLYAFMLGFAKPCSAQFFAFNPFLAPINPFLYPAYPPFPFVPSVPTFPVMSLNPLPSLPTLSRTGAATVIVLPPAAPAVTAYAPLGTLTLTPSTLVFLILYLTLAE
ncbi:MAG: hypothetical protein ACMUHX_04480 [bacterium]